ncbi:MAG: ParB/Srx family N-terminal domain-containing protein [Cetobacterium sp.]
MKIVIKKISELKKYERNAKLHPDWQIKQIADSIKEFGFNDPIAIDENGVIIEGHGRVEALKKLGYEEIEVIELKHLSAMQKKAYVLAHNKINMNTGLDEEILKRELEELKEFDFDLDLTGISDFELNDLMVAELE